MLRAVATAAADRSAQVQASGHPAETATDQHSRDGRHVRRQRGQDSGHGRTAAPAQSERYQKSDYPQSGSEKVARRQ